jgi:putative ABC transport system substrate-binding protein
MNRRRSIAALAALAAGASLLRARAADEVPRVAILMYGSRANTAGRVGAFIGAMRALGYDEGRTIAYDLRSANGQDDLLRSHARNLAMGADVILSGSVPATRALRAANIRVPVVIAAPEDPVAEGFVRSLDKPGGNFTGVASNLVDHLDRQMQLLLTVAPRLTRVIALLNPTELLYRPFRARLEAAARGTRLVVADASTPQQVERAFQTPAGDGQDGLIVTADTLFYNERRTIAEMAARAGRPVVYPIRGYVEAGGLMSWGPNPEANFGRAAAYVDKILRGARPADLPLEPSARLELVVNQRAIRNLGLSLPAELEKQAVVIRSS